MRLRSQITFGLRIIVLAVVAILANLAGFARGQSADISLRIQSVPAQGGDITPIPGVYHFKPETEVVLTAVPKPGYKFICWMGGVENPAARNTITYLSGPKTIVAVFERTEYDNYFAQSGSNGGGGGGDGAGGYIPNAENFSPLMSGGALGKSSKPISVSSPVDIEQLMPEKSVFITPVQNEPVVPEPTTAILLGLGGLFTFARHRMGRHTL